ncbi:lipoprotein N-acyltransferase Lnb domain-containing protein [Polaribacter sp.]|uniref:lipoprotein N-acyltransferase Lnb domain-containing protein n=1 Tax=Polaribacter sp. TaxID=1920175 RepID=UPI003F6C8F7B
MKKSFLLIFFFLLLIKPVKAQVQLSTYAEISIVTAGPGTALYEAFGHSAIRIKDPVLRLDIIYNYGMFDFNAPNFYGNFTKGKLLYKLARYDFKYFLASYKKDKRWVKQQVLNLNKKQRQAFFMYLENNALPENATYFYDPYFNNCATKLRDITNSILGDKLQFSAEKIEEELSFRQLMDNESPWNTWGSFGINLALGNKLDAKANYKEYMYLPDYVYRIFNESMVYIHNQPKKLVKREDVLLDFKEVKQTIPILNPFLVFTAFCLLGLLITYKDFKKNKITKWFDFVLLFTTGIIGVLIVFLWFFTNHSTTPNNFNFLWAFAPNLIIAILTFKKTRKQWITLYFKILVLLIVLVPIFWIIGIQSFPIAVIPLLILFFVRYLFLSRKPITIT